MWTKGVQGFDTLPFDNFFWKSAVGFQAIPPSQQQAKSRFLCERMQQRMTNLQEALRQLEEEAEEAVEDTTRLEPVFFKVCGFFGVFLVTIYPVK